MFYCNVLYYRLYSTLLVSIASRCPLPPDTFLLSRDAGLFLSFSHVAPTCALLRMSPLSATHGVQASGHHSLFIFYHIRTHSFWH